MSCESIRNQFFLLLYGELTFGEEELVEQHLASCADCRAELDRQRALADAASAEAVDVPDDLLTRCRRDLRFKTAIAARQPRARHGILARIHQSLNLLSAFSAGAVWKPAGAMALLLVGFFAARITAPRAVQSPSEPIATRIRYLQPDSAGRVRIVVDETRQRVLTGSLDDEGVLRTLLAAARDPEDPGLRAESVELLKGRASSREVRGTLVQALRHDPNAGVRMRALEGLRAYSAEPESRRALVDVLLADDNPGVRTQAVDLLTQQKDISFVPAFQRSLEREDNGYVRLRLQNALREMNASMETF
jgi:hypothetical protein